MSIPDHASPTARLISERILDLSHSKTLAEISAEAGFKNPKMMTLLKSGEIKLPLDRVSSLAKALEVDPAYLMRLSLDQAFGVRVAKVITDIFGTPTTENERGWLAEIRSASGDADPKPTDTARKALWAIFEK